jgi:hypothetical protein
MPNNNILTSSWKDKGVKDRSSIVDIVEAITDETRRMVNGETKKVMLVFKRIPLKVRSFGISQM